MKSILSRFVSALLARFSDHKPMKKVGRSPRRPTVECLEERVCMHNEPAGGGRLHSDVWGEGNYAYIGHYGEETGVEIFDVTNPANPREVAVFRSAFGWNDIRDIHVQNGIGFFASDTGGGVHVVDVRNPLRPTQLARITSAIGGHDRVHTLTVEGNYLYEADSRTPNIKVFDIRNPAAPVFVRTITSASGGPIHEATAKNGRLYTAVINSVGYSDIFDVSNVGNVAVPVPRLGTFVTGSYAHTAWPTEDGRFLAVARETAGGDVRIWNITNPASPTLAATLTLPRTEAYTAHQVMIVGTRLYVSWYQAGVLVFDVTNPAQPRLLHRFDTFLQPTGSSTYAGCWGVIPLPDTHRVLASDMQTGLRVINFHTGTITGTAFNDLNRNGLRETREPALGGWTVYVDANNNGRRELTEKTVTTSAGGQYTLPNLNPGLVRVRLLLRVGWARTSPLRNVQLAAGQVVGGVNLGAVPTRRTPAATSPGLWDWPAETQYDFLLPYLETTEKLLWRMKSRPI